MLSIDIGHLADRLYRPPPVIHHVYNQCLLRKTITVDLSRDPKSVTSQSREVVSSGVIRPNLRVRAAAADAAAAAAAASSAQKPQDFCCHVAPKRCRSASSLPPDHTPPRPARRGVSWRKIRRKDDPPVMFSTGSFYRNGRFLSGSRDCMKTGSSTGLYHCVRLVTSDSLG